MKTQMLALAAALLVVGPAAAQESPLLELARSDFRTQKVAIVTAAMQLDEGQSSTFWPVYREYQAELTALWDRRLALIKDYADSYQIMTDQKAKDLAQQALRLEEDGVKLRRKYFDRMSKALTPVIAGRFLQVENQIDLLVRIQIASELPLLHKPE